MARQEKQNPNPAQRRPIQVVGQPIEKLSDGEIANLYYEESELARELKVDVRTLRRWANLRCGPPRTMVGRRILYKKTSVLQWLIDREQRPPKRAAR
jgi:hypothetical protein